MTTNTQQLATLLDQVMANLLCAECRQWLSDARQDISRATTDLSKAARILAELLQQEPIATVLLPDPLDERDGPYLHLGAWERLRALPAGSKLFASPLIQPGQAPAGMALIRLDYLHATRRDLEDCRRLISHIGGFDADYCCAAEERLKEIDAALAAAGIEHHPDDAAVDRFAEALKAKLARSRAKGRGGWDNAEVCSVEDLARMLIEHLDKANAGTFEDVATFAMMLHQRGADPAVLAEAIQARDAAQARGAELEKQVPEGYRLIRIEHFDAIKASLEPQQVDAYRGRNVWDDDKVYANWRACDQALDQIKDVLQEVEWDAENELAELFCAAPQPVAKGDGSHA